MLKFKVTSCEKSKFSDLFVAICDQVMSNDRVGKRVHVRFTKTKAKGHELELDPSEIQERISEKGHKYYVA